MVHVVPGTGPCSSPPSGVSPSLVPGSGPCSSTADISPSLVPGNGPCSTTAGNSILHPTVAEDDALASDVGLCPADVPTTLSLYPQYDQVKTQLCNVFGTVQSTIAFGSCIPHKNLTFSKFFESFFEYLYSSNFSYNEIHISGATWNSSGCFGDTVFADPRLARLKRSGMQRTVLASDVSCLQETHADPTEAIQIFKDWSHSHYIWHSYGPDRSTGGISTFIKKTWGREALFIFSVEICPGRILVTFVVFPSQTYTIANIHNLPDWSASDRRTHFRNLDRILAPLPMSC